MVMLVVLLFQHVLRHILRLRNPTTARLLPLRGKRLGELAAIPNLRAPPVENVNRNHDQARQRSQDRRRVVHGRVGEVADVVVQRRGVHGRDTSEEVSRPRVATCGRSRVDAVGRDHVVDGGEVDGVVGDADEGREDHRHDPVRDLRALRRPREAEETYGLEWRRPQKPFEAALRDHGVAAVLLAVVRVAPEPRVVGEVGDEVGQVDGDKRPRDGQDAEVPLLVHGLEALEEGEDEGVGEAGEQGEAEHDGLGDQHDPGAHPDGAELFDGDSRRL